LATSIVSKIIIVILDIIVVDGNDGKENSTAFASLVGEFNRELG
jgi:hypothetical protein